jgi:hypothetical protein
MKTTLKEGVTTIHDDDGLIAIIYKDMKTRKNVFYKCSEMDMTELEHLVGSDVAKITPQTT